MQSAACVIVLSVVEVGSSVELSVKDIDFERREITVRRGKEQKDRRVMLPDVVTAALRSHLEDVSTTMTYTHVLNRGGLGVRSPIDRALACGGFAAIRH